MINTKNIFCMCSLVLILVSFSLINISSVKAGVYSANVPAWQGEWIWAKTDNAPALAVDLRSYFLAHPGGWGEAIVNRILGNFSAAGGRTVYWYLDDGKNYIFFPGENKCSYPVFKWKNWGVDFSKFDFPAHAQKISKRLGLMLYFVAVEKIAPVAKKHYPSARVVGRGELPENLLFASTVNFRKLSKEGLIKKKLRFKKEFSVKGKTATGKVCLTAQKKYWFSMDDKLIGVNSDWWRGETYDISAFLTDGKHEICVAVEPDDYYSGLLLNMKWKTESGNEFCLNTDSSWEYSVEAQNSDMWKPVDIVGFEGIGSRFRLKDVWKNPTSILVLEGMEKLKVDSSLMEFYYNSKNEKLQMFQRKNTGKKQGCIVSGVPSYLELNLKRPVFISELHIKFAEVFLSSPWGYRLQGHINGEWKDLIIPVDVGNVKEILKAKKGIAVHAFTPCNIKQLRLLFVPLKFLNVVNALDFNVNNNENLCEIAGITVFKAPDGE